MECVLYVSPVGSLWHGWRVEAVATSPPSPDPGSRYPLSCAILLPAIFHHFAEAFSAFRFSIFSLPIDFSFGVSVLVSHFYLVAGALFFASILIQVELEAGGGHQKILE